MSQGTHKNCYGTMFPTVLRPDTDRVISGKVFAYELKMANGSFISHRDVSASIPQWDDCLACPEFDHCYKLSQGKLLLETAIQ